MAIQIQGFNIGQDIALSMMSSAGDIFLAEQLGYVMDFDAEAEDIELKIVPISGGGVPIIQDIPCGWRGSIMFTRFGPALTQLAIDLSDAYHDQGIIQQFLMMGNVLNRNGQIDEYIFQGLQFVKPRFGNFRTDKEVDQRIDFRASRLRSAGSSVQFLPNLLAA